MLKKLAIGFAVLVVIGLGVVAWLWNQATALPEWYVEEAAGQPAPLSSKEPEDPPQWVAVDPEGKPLEDYDPIPLESVDAPAPADAPEPRRKASRPKKKKRAKGKRHEIRGFHRRAGRRAPKGDDGERVRAVKASRAVYENGELELGMIVDLSNFPKDKLNEVDRRRYERAVKNFPALAKRDVWVGVEDRPRNVDGYLQLGPDAMVRVGKLRYSLASAAKKVGMKPTQLRAELNRELRRLGLVDPDAH